MIVFREGLEAVLILAALMASMVGVQRRYRRPLLIGVGFALLASVATWVIAQTMLDSLAGFGERLEAIVSLVAIGMLLLILNWFYHRVYWQENLQDLHRRKKRVLAGAGLSLAAAQVAGLIALGFSSVYREGFETVLFLQALTLEAGAWTVLQGVALGFAGVLAVFVLVVALERKLPHKKMLIATGLMITWVLVVMVGQTVQTMQKVGWLAVTPDRGPRAALLGRAVARPLSDLARAAGANRRGGLRDRELLRGRAPPSSPACTHPRARAARDRRARPLGVETRFLQPSVARAPLRTLPPWSTLRPSSRTSRRASSRWSPASTSRPGT